VVNSFSTSDIICVYDLSIGLWNCSDGVVFCCFSDQQILTVKVFDLILKTQKSIMHSRVNLTIWWKMFGKQWKKCDCISVELNNKKFRTT
jgi:hypothetical protein